MPSNYLHSHPSLSSLNFKPVLNYLNEPIKDIAVAVRASAMVVKKGTKARWWLDILVNILLKLLGCRVSCHEVLKVDIHEVGVNCKLLIVNFKCDPMIYKMFLLIYLYYAFF